MYAPAPTTSSSDEPVQETRCPELVERRLQPHAGGRVLLAQIDVALGRAERPHREHGRLDHQVRPELHDVAVLDRSRLALVGVHDDVRRARLARDRLPLHAGREAGAAVSREPRGLQLLDDPLERGRLAQEREAAARLVVGERRVTRAEPDRRAVVRRVGHGRDDLVAARHRGREVAMAEARDLDRAGRALEELARAEAVADGPGADAYGVGGNLQERVERDDLVHLAAADVHVVGERVRELHRDRADLAPDAAEVVEEPCPLARKLGEQRREAQHVHAASLFRPWRPPERLRPGAATLLLEAALAGARARLRRDPAPGNGQAPHAASRRDARPPAPGCAPGSARPARRREGRRPPGRRRAASGCR